jgi:crotonobetainyl-CoA:carnitine CoA-transferase CaiB-like acyl-CoA transferase
VTDADGIERELVTAPVQFDEEPLAIGRAPQFAEHSAELLAELGFDDERIRAFKAGGGVA